jgi:membrane protease YdiL (CAAX protease family)
MVGTAVGFTMLAIGLSWTIWLPLAWSGSDSPIKDLGSFGPAVAALIVVMARRDRRNDWSLRLRTWRVPLRWYALVLAGPVVVCAAVVVVATALGTTGLRFNDPAELYLVVPVFFVVLVLGGPLGEEPGWRGLLLPTLTERTSFPVAGLVVGVVWACWHLPLFLIPGAPQAELPVAAYLALTVALGVIYGSLAQHTRGSVPVAILLHTSSNTSAGLLPLLPADAGGSTLPFLSLTAVVVLTAAALLVRDLSRHRAGSRRAQPRGS